MAAANPRFSSDGGPASRGGFPAGESSNDRDGPGGGSSGEGERDRATFECNICLDTARDAVISMCGHLFWGSISSWESPPPAPLVGPQSIPRPAWRCTSSNVSWVKPGASLMAGHFQNTSPGRETSRRHPNQMPKPPQLAPLDVEEQRFYSTSLSPHSISKAEPGHPVEETHFSSLYSPSHSFGHHSKLVTSWPCLHQWLETRPSRQQCPVCKAGISREKVIPLYGRGSSSQEDPRLKTPPRPQGQRTEPESRGGMFPGFGETGFHMSFGIGAFPFGFFTTVFNTNDPFHRADQYAADPQGNGNLNNGNNNNWQDSLFLFVAIIFFFWLLSV